MLRTALFAISTAAMLAGSAALAADYPDRPITLICPFAPGGTSDTLARLFAAEMSKDLGQTIVVENRAGGAGVVGSQIAAEAKPDGYTLLVGDLGPLVIAPLAKSDLPYKPSDFVPVFNFANVSNAIVVNSGLGVKTIPDLVALAKAKPGSINFSSGGVGTPSHFSGAMFAVLAGIGKDVVHVPYNGGANAAVAAASGEVQYYGGPLAGNMMGVIDAGQVVALGVTGGKRVAAIPDVPTFAEAGLPDFNVVAWYGIFALAGTPPEIIEKINAAGNRATESPALIAALATQGIEPIKNTPEEYGAQWKQDAEAYGKLVAEGAVTFE